MIFNYYLITEDDEKKEQLLLDARQVNSTYAVTKLLNENGIYLDDYTNPVQISQSLCSIDFKILYKRKGKPGSIGISQIVYEVITEG